MCLLTHTLLGEQAKEGALKRLGDKAKDVVKDKVDGLKDRALDMKDRVLNVKDNIKENGLLRTGKDLGRDKLRQQAEMAKDMARQELSGQNLAAQAKYGAQDGLAQIEEQQYQQQQYQQQQAAQEWA